MKKIQKFTRMKKSVHSTHENTYDVGEIATFVARCHPEVVESLNSVIRHPRSLARPTPSWRPPSKALPALPGADGLTATVTRHRVGPRVRARMQGFGAATPPAYLISVRITSPEAHDIYPEVAEGWIRTLVSERNAHCVHVFDEDNAPTFLWMVDGDYQPMRSPASLFEKESKAA